MLEKTTAKSSGVRSVKVATTDVYRTVSVEHTVYDVVPVGSTYVP